MNKSAASFTKQASKFLKFWKCPQHFLFWLNIIYSFTRKGFTEHLLGLGMESQAFPHSSCDTVVSRPFISKPIWRSFQNTMLLLLFLQAIFHWPYFFSSWVCTLSSCCRNSLFSVPLDLFISVVPRFNSISPVHIWCLLVGSWWW